MENEQEKYKVEALKPNGFQDNYYCPYCKRELLYLWKDGHLIGIGLSRWVYCDNCKKKFKLSLYGIQEQEVEFNIEVKQEVARHSSQA